MKRVLIIGTRQRGAFSHIVKYTLTKNNYFCYPYDHRAKEAARGTKRVSEDILFLIDRLNIDYLLVIKGRGLDPQIIKDAPCKTILWWLDHHARYVDFEMYRQVYDKYYLIEEGQGHPWMPIGILPDINKPIFSEDDIFKSDLVFCGTAHAERSKRIIKIIQNMPWITKIWGNGWPSIPEVFMGRAVYWDELMKAYTGAKLILNNHYIKGITPNMRSIEAPASGVAMISDTGRGLEMCLKKDKEYIAYETELEAKRLILKYLEDKDERLKIGQAGMKRVYKDHLLIDKLEEMFK